MMETRQDRHDPEELDKPPYSSKSYWDYSSDSRHLRLGADDSDRGPKNSVIHSCGRYLQKVATGLISLFSGMGVTIQLFCQSQQDYHPAISGKPGKPCR